MVEQKKTNARYEVRRSWITINQIRISAKNSTPSIELNGEYTKKTKFRYKEWKTMENWKEKKQMKRSRH